MSELSGWLNCGCGSLEGEERRGNGISQDLGFPANLSPATLFHYPKPQESPMNQLVKIILAIFLPPVAAFLQVGVSLHFGLNIVLCLLGGIPGMVHALWLVLTDRHG
jgi:uncharacterized membrane protein YqaE (UPF0057 family)